MSNSALVSYQAISPNRTPNRNHKIDTITPHCYVGNVTLARMAKGFLDPTKKAAPNYGISFDGKIGLFVPEADRSWCSSNAANDHRAITIECASSNLYPYVVNDQVFDALVDLCVDICIRNEIPALLWKADQKLIGKVDQQNITVHRWFAKKSCPGANLYGRLGTLAKKVNERLNVKPIDSPIKVRVTIPDLRIRSGPSTEYKNMGYCPIGVYTITERTSGKGSTLGWGKLKSGKGWISLDYVDAL